MKARMKTYLPIVAAAVMLGACSKIEQAEAPHTRICYNVVQLHGTKADPTYPTDRPFISYAFMMPEGEKWEDEGKRNSYAQPYISGATISFDGMHWYDPSKTYYWPTSGSLTFFSFSPEAVKTTDTTVDKTNGVTIKDWDVDANQTVDIMVADVQTGQTANRSEGLYTGVPTIFRHKLSQIVGFEFNTLKDYSSSTKFYVTRISLKNIKQKGTYVSGPLVGTTSSLIGKWTLDGSSGAKSYPYYDGGTTGTEVVYNDGTGNNTKVGSGVIMLLPQTFSDPGETPDWAKTPHLEIAYKVGSEPKTARVSLYDLFAPSHELGMNKQITIKVTFSNEGNLILWAPDQEDWEGSEFSIVI